MRRILQIGVIGGACAGMALAAFLLTIGHGPIDEAKELAASHSATGTASHEEMFSRGVQQLGGALGMLVFGVALGLIFMVVWGAASARLSRASPMVATLQLGAVAFGTVVVVPAIKYPANPPGFSDAATVDERTIQYVLVLASSILLTVAVWQLVIRLSQTRSTVTCAWAGAAAYCGGLAAIAIVLPASPDAIDAPADLVWRFRLSSLVGMGVGFLVLALVTGTLLTRSAASGGLVRRPGGRTSVDHMTSARETRPVKVE